MMLLYVTYLCLFLSTLVSIQAAGGGSVTDKGAWTGAKTWWNYDYSQVATNCPTCSETTKCGPHCWPAINQPGKTNMCGMDNQTPINIAGGKVDLTLSYPSFNVKDGGCKGWEQFADDHAFEVAFYEEGCTNMKLTYKGTEYTLLQLHFHSPSEHTFGGGYTDAELHMVHKSDDGKLLVLGVMIVGLADHVPNSNNNDLRNDVLQIFWNAAETGNNAANKYGTKYEVHVDKALNVYQEFLPASNVYYTYSGSLTTFPCTEGVTWILHEQPIYVSQTDVDKLRDSVAKAPGTIIDTVTGNDNRPILPLKGRVVTKYIGVDNLQAMITTTASPTTSPNAVEHPETNVALAVGIAAIVIACIALLLHILHAFNLTKIGGAGSTYSQVPAKSAESAVELPKA